MQTTPAPDGSGCECILERGGIAAFSEFSKDPAYSGAKLAASVCYRCWCVATAPPPPGRAA